MRRTLLSLLFAMLAFVAIGEVSHAQGWYGAIVIRNPSWTPGNTYRCVQAERRNFSTGCGTFIQQFIICYRPGPIPCVFNPYPPFDPFAYQVASQRIQAGILSGRETVQQGNRTAVVSWSAPSTADGGDTHITETEGTPEGN